MKGTAEKGREGRGHQASLTKMKFAMLVPYESNIQRERH